MKNHPITYRSFLRILLVVIPMWAMSAWIFPSLSMAQPNVVAENLHVWVYGHGELNAYMKKISISEKGPRYICIVNIESNRDGSLINFHTYGFTPRNDTVVAYYFARGGRPHWEQVGVVADDPTLNAVWQAMKPYLKKHGISDVETGKSSTTKPRIPKTEYSIGGIDLGCTLEYVESVYGEPEDKDYKDLSEFGGKGNMQVTYIYSPTFSVRAWGKTSDDEENWKVSGFSCKDSSKTTPSGLHVGMPYSAVTKKYAPGKKSTHPKNGKTYYNHGGMRFYVDSKDIITEIAFFADI